jgi:hypothetical protein
MSMEFSEFRRLLGAEPRSQDPSFLRARESSAEFRTAAEEADRFESQLDSALKVPAPTGLPELLRAIPRSAPRGRGQRFGLRFAMAAALLIAVGAAGLTWRMNTGWDSVQDYVADHFRHDGPAMLAAAAGEPLPVDVGAVLAEFGMTASPALAEIVNVIKTCPTPDGKGVHMVLDTAQGLVTVIYMPDTPVADGAHIRFDERDAVLVTLRSGSAVIVGSESQQVAGLQSLIRESLVPGDKSS